MTTGDLAAYLAAQRASSPSRGPGVLHELTWGQRGIYEHFRRNGFAMSAAAVAVFWRLPRPCEPAVVQAVLDHLVERHECLRTVYFDVAGAPLDPSHPAPAGRVRQQVELARPVAAPVLTCASDEVNGYAEHLLKLAEQEFSFDPHDPSAMRVMLIATGDGVVAVAGVISHMAVDSFGVTTLGQEFDHLVRRGLDGRPFDGLPPARQPRELVADEASAIAARANAATIRHFRSVLRDAPARFVSSGRARADLRVSKVKGLSWTLQRSIDRIARRTSTAVPTVLSALVMAQLAELTGEPRVLLRTLHARRHWFSGVSYVAPQSLPSLVLVDVPPRFSDLLGTARTAAATASGRADFDVCALNDLHAEKSRAIGAALDGFILFNCWDMRTPTAVADVPPRPTEVEVWPRADILLDMQGEVAFWSQLEPGAIWVNLSFNEDLVGVDAKTFLDRLEQFAAAVADDIHPPAREKCVATNDLLVLGDDGLKLYAPVEHEANFQYREIFEHECYDQFALSEEPTIVDVGANIGLFTVFAKRQWPRATILAFEPVPRTADYLRRNIELHGLSDVRVVHEAVGERVEQTSFVHYPNMPGNSTRYPEDKQLQIDVVRQRHPDWDVAAQYEPENLTVQVRRLEAHLAGLARVDLLKVDVEGAELDVLRGIAEDQWDRIDNVVMEVQDLHGRMAQIEELLKSRGFRVEIQPSPVVYPEIFTYLLVAQRAG